MHAKRLNEESLSWLHDWRQNPSGAEDAQLILIGHSMGGLVARYFLECLGGWQHTRTLITLGTPHLGAVNTLDFLVHGMKKRIGPLGVDLSPVLGSLPSAYQLLPIYNCIETASGQFEGVVEAASEGRLPNVDATRAAAARQFHLEIEESQKRNSENDLYRRAGYRMVPLVGIEQPTYQSAVCKDDGVEMTRSLDGQDFKGDGTVPRLSATPIELHNQNREIFAAQKHGALQNDGGALINLHGILTQPEFDLNRFRDEAPVVLSVDMDDAFLPGEPLAVRAKASEGNPVIQVKLTPLSGGESFTDRLQRDRTSGWHVAEFNLEPGIWQVVVSAENADPVTDVAVVSAADES